MGGNTSRLYLDNKSPVAMQLTSLSLESDVKPMIRRWNDMGSPLILNLKTVGVILAVQNPMATAVIFRKFDHDNNGLVDAFFILVAVIISSQAPMEDKIHCLTSIFDLSGDGTLTLDEVDVMTECSLKVLRTLFSSNPLNHWLNNISNTPVMSFFSQTVLAKDNILQMNINRKHFFEYLISDEGTLSFLETVSNVFLWQKSFFQVENMCYHAIHDFELFKLHTYVLDEEKSHHSYIHSDFIASNSILSLKCGFRSNHLWKLFIATISRINEIESTGENNTSYHQEMIIPPKTPNAPLLNSSKSLRQKNKANLKISTIQNKPATSQQYVVESNIFAIAMRIYSAFHFVSRKPVVSFKAMNKKMLTEWMVDVDENNGRDMEDLMKVYHLLPPTKFNDTQTEGELKAEQKLFSEDSKPPLLSRHLTIGAHDLALVFLLAFGDEAQIEYSTTDEGLMALHEVYNRNLSHLLDNYPLEESEYAIPSSVLSGKIEKFYEQMLIAIHNSQQKRISLEMWFCTILPYFSKAGMTSP